MHIGVMYSTRYSCKILMKLEFTQKILEKYAFIRFHKNSSSGSRVVLCGRTDRHKETKIAFRNFANAPNNYTTQGIFYTNSSLGSNIEREAEISLTLLANITKISARTADGTTRFVLGTSRKKVIHY
jgi:hypothetical protein